MSLTSYANRDARVNCWCQRQCKTRQLHYRRTTVSQPPRFGISRAAARPAGATAAKRWSWFARQRSRPVANFLAAPTCPPGVRQRDIDTLVGTAEHDRAL
jgi:hypothetical protein